MVEQLYRFLHTPNWKRQHRWRKAVWHAMSSLGLTGLHALPMNRRWIEIHHRPMPLRHLDPAHVGLRLVQISDLHYSPVVWKKYLEQMLEWVNNQHPDLIVVTGDLITGGYRYAPRVANMLSRLQARFGVICTFGNHDYSWYARAQVLEGIRRADFLEKCLIDKGLIVLRNEVMRICPTLLESDRAQPRSNQGTGRKPLVLVGLDDEWSGAIDPARAFHGLTDDLPIICLNHNPANCEQLLCYPWQWMLSGHTHGRQTADSPIARRLKIPRRHFTHGYYAIQGRHLYVNRGLSYGQRVKHWCRPEVTVFRLTQAESAADAKPQAA